jgi:alginate O-acetyltransferase complex protein AlgI
MHGLFLVLERGRWGRILDYCPAVLQHFYMLLVVLTAWVFFRADTLVHSISYLSAMYSWPLNWNVHSGIAIHLDQEFYSVLIAGLILSAPLYRRLVVAIKGMIADMSYILSLIYLLKLLLLFVILYYSVMEIAIGSYNPFIYFRF